jgi:mycothiol synthase
MSGQVGQWTVERFYAEMRDKPVFRPDGLFFAVHDDVPVATACAWWVLKEYGPHVGILHMVATHPEHRHLGLGRAVSLSVMHFFAQLQMQACVLSTTSQRLAAIKLYLSLGFEPELDTPEIQALWPEILHSLALKPRP